MSDDYEVGYGKPPKHSQFPKGTSGNPRGRPRGARGLKSDLLAALSARQTIRINGKQVRGNRQEQMLRTLATRAAAGDLKAQALLIPLILQALGIEDRGDSRERLSTHDQALLDELLAPQPTALQALPHEPASDSNDDQSVTPLGGHEETDNG